MRPMNSAAILSIKPIYASQILSGTKTIELRKSSMGLKAGDVILVYASAPEQNLAFWLRLKRIEPLPVEIMWQRYNGRLGIEHEDYIKYFDGVRLATGLHVGEVHPIAPIPLQRIQHLVPGFVPPQGILWLREESGRYEHLLAELSDPLPADVFPQRSLAFDTPVPRRQTG